MEGLALARVVAELQAAVPARTLGWAFPDETTAALLLDGVGNVVFSYRPPTPALFVSRERLTGEPGSPFQRLLASRLRGELTLVEQLKLDRVALLRFSGERGFVDQPPLRLLFELTGRNGNLLVLEDGEDFSGRIVAAAREITSGRNRFRTVRTGGLYTPPPPYEKLDPRALTDEQAQELALLPLGRWRERLDGIGLNLSAELVRRAHVRADEAPGDRLPQVLEALRGLILDPTVTAGSLNEESRAAARAEKATGLRKALTGPLEKRRTLLTNQLGDLTRAEVGLDEAAVQRQEADLLMAYSRDVTPGASHVVLTGFDGEERPIALDPQLTAVANAERRYARARRREEVYERLAEREPALREELTEVEARLRGLEGASLEDLEALSAELESEKPAAAPGIGARFTSPGGYEVLVGRNNKENAALTHRLGRSMDFWFHVQGFQGSHVLVRSGGRDLPLPDILFAARLAAAHSKARSSGNVAVDYTRIKHVWRPRGSPAGKVLYTQQKTVYVDPEVPGGAA